MKHASSRHQVIQGQGSNMNATKTKLQHQDKKIKVNQINSSSVIQANQVYMQCKDHGYNKCTYMDSENRSAQQQ
jgi:hypothetical protein